MTFCPDDVSTLKRLVLEEQGDFALAYVSRYIDQLRAERDFRSASLWSMVLAELYSAVEKEKQAAVQELEERPPIVLVHSR
ncbi:MAG: hypothetical protein JJ850_06620 [Kordiimonadaceae bacterium]|nr:hypothetical protein [Kordiimonadaceae bacterium]MBO6567999.1 hypothetical protein [Kordiimonadaceae bacterium]MBO6964271.1 hypothetical protein [Kordiimonadaceae bacterium]